MDRWDDENDLWLDAFSEAPSEPCENEATFFAARRELGLGVGLDEAGNLVSETRGIDTLPLRL